jgi:tetratricopeptide (TPR) repeat protein
MSGFLLCTNHSDVPYYLNDIDKNIYSLEEIGYYLYNHVYLVDESFFSEELISYIEEELNLKLVADGIRQAKEQRAGLSALISYVVNATSYFSAEELVQLQKELELLGQKTGVERLKAKGDILLSNGKYRRAFTCYETILKKRWDSTLGNGFYGNVYNNLGIVCANMFKYKDAGECFRQAYKLTGNLGILKHIILNDYLVGNMAELEQDIRKYKVSDRMIAECEKKLADAKASIRVDEKEPEQIIQKMLSAYRQDI